jgi:hypothetical protein
MAKPIKTTPGIDDCDFFVVSAPSTSVSDTFAYYDRLRSYLVHEDDLLNSRLTWSLTVHGFLFAVFGILTGKIADQFTELHKTLNSPVLPENVISGLFFLQIPIAVFGAIVASKSRNAIIAAHNAIQHIYAISTFGGLIKSGSILTKANTAITQGTLEVKLSLKPDIQAASRFLVDPGSPAEEEIVVESTTNEGFIATFSKPHNQGVKMKLLGFALPTVIGGGGHTNHIKGAQDYYLALPRYAMWVWILLAFISIGFCSTSIFGRSWFFSLFEVH